MMTLLAEGLPELVTPTGTATAIGVFVLMAITAMAGGLFIYNQILSAQVNRKSLAAPAVAQSSISGQPISITIDKALEEKFVGKPDFEKFEQYVHKAHHDNKNEFQAVKSAGDNRDHELAALQERTVSQTRAIDALSVKVDRGFDRVTDKVEQLIRDDSKKGGSR
jgi:hypothetical protein